MAANGSLVPALLCVAKATHALLAPRVPFSPLHSGTSVPSRHEYFRLVRQLTCFAVTLRARMALELFAVCPPGVEPLLADELRELGFLGRAVPGGVELQGGMEMVAQCNLWLRTASRVLVRLGRV